MATTARPISELVGGIRDTSGTAVASGYARFYQPYTLVQQTVYSDAACSTALGQPVSLNAAGQATVYTLEAVRMIVLSNDSATTHYDGLVNVNRADAVYLTVPGINGGAETTLEAVLATIQESLGDGFQYQWLGNTSATPRAWNVALGERAISVKDFGAVGDGVTDDTDAIQDATDSAAGAVFFPAGTYKITAAITTANGQAHHWFGAGRGHSYIKNFGTTTRAFDLTADDDHRYVISDLTISANTASSAAAIYSPVAGSVGVTIERVTITGHESGIAVGTLGRARDCHVTYTGTDAADRGIDFTDYGHVQDCVVVGPGTGGSDTGVFLQFGGMAERTRVSAAKNGFAIGSGAGARCVGTALVAASCGVGFNVPGGTSMVTLTGCHGMSNTTDIVYGASNAEITLVGCPFTTSSGTIKQGDPSHRVSLVAVSDATAAPTWTPDFTDRCGLQQFTSTYAAGVPTVTIAAPTNLAYLVDGTIVYFTLLKTGANNLTLVWNAAYLDIDLSSWSGPGTVTSGTGFTLAFRKSGATLVLVPISTAFSV